MADKVAIHMPNKSQGKSRVSVSLGGKVNDVKLARQLEKQITTMPVKMQDVLAALAKRKEQRSSTDLLIIAQLLKKSDFMRKFKLKGRLLLEFYRRVRLSTMVADSMVPQDVGLYIIVEGQCTEKIMKRKFPTMHKAAISLGSCYGRQEPVTRQQNKRKLTTAMSYDSLKTDEEENDSPKEEFVQFNETLFEGQSIGFNLENSWFDQSSDRTRKVLVESELCHFAFIEQAVVKRIVKKHRQRQVQKLLSILLQLPYFQGITRNTALKAAQCLEKQHPVRGQVLLRQGEQIIPPILILVNKGQLRVTKGVQDTHLSQPTSQNTLIRNNLLEKNLPKAKLELGMLSQGCILGMEDIVRGNAHYSISVECASNKASVYIASGKRLEKLQQMTLIWAQILEQSEKNARTFEAQFNQATQKRQQFTFGKRHMTAVDPESQLQHQRQIVREPKRSTLEMIERLRDETRQNWLKVQERDKDQDQNRGRRASSQLQLNVQKRNQQEELVGVPTDTEKRTVNLKTVTIQPPIEKLRQMNSAQQHRLAQIQRKHALCLLRNQEQKQFKIKESQFAMMKWRQDSEYQYSVSDATFVSATVSEKQPRNYPPACDTLTSSIDFTTGFKNASVASTGEPMLLWERALGQGSTTSTAQTPQQQTSIMQNQTIISTTKHFSTLQQSSEFLSAKRQPRAINGFGQRRVTTSMTKSSTDFLESIDVDFDAMMVQRQGRQKLSSISLLMQNEHESSTIVSDIYGNTGDRSSHGSKGRPRLQRQGSLWQSSAANRLRKKAP